MKYKEKKKFVPVYFKMDLAVSDKVKELQDETNYSRTKLIEKALEAYYEQVIKNKS